jgi:NADH:ubiquinone oxidoreductase subunit E
MAAQTVLQSVQQLPGASSARVNDAVTERTAELEKRFGELYVMVCDVTHCYLPTCHLSLRSGVVTLLTVSTVKSAV